jgi:hypothetical protein
MPTCVISPKWADVKGWHTVVKNNRPIVCIDFVLHTNEKWLPLILSQAGFFPSNGEVKRNRSDLWRDVVHGETIELKWARICIVKHPSVERQAS